MQSCINFNSTYGDLNILGDRDIEIIRGTCPVKLQSMINLFKSNKGDYELDYDYSIDVEKYIGKPISKGLADSISNTIAYRLQKHGIIKFKTDAVILHIIDDYTIHFRIIVPGLESITLEFLQNKGFQIE